MRVHYLQHVPYEGLGWIQEWAETRSHELSGTMMFDDGTTAPGLPDPHAVDLLVVMGGPMNVYEHEKYPWLLVEKEVIGAAIAAGKVVLGICLGAQLIADVLGATVTRAPCEETGWYPVELTEAGRDLEVFAHLPDSFAVLHWHGDTFSIPAGASHAASSGVCESQAFVLDHGRVIGLQFHLEETRESLTELVRAAGQELPDGSSSAGTEARRGPWISSAAELLAPDAPFDACREMLFGLLDRMVMR